MSDLGNQVIIEMSAPLGAGVSKLAAKIKNTLQLDGKVVRLYDTTVAKGSIPDVMPKDCHVIIIVRSA